MQLLRRAKIGDPKIGVGVKRKSGHAVARRITYSRSDRSALLENLRLSVGVNMRKPATKRSGPCRAVPRVYSNCDHIRHRIQLRVAVLVKGKPIRTLQFKNTAGIVLVIPTAVYS